MVDLKAEFAYPLPMYVIADLLGIEESLLPRLRELFEKFFSTQTPPQEFVATLTEVTQIMQETVAAKRESPGDDLNSVDATVVSHAVALDTDAPTKAIRSYAPEGVHRIVEVSLSANADLDNAVAGLDAVIAAYGTRSDRTELPFWPMLFNNVTVRLLGSDDFPVDAKRQAARDLTAAAAVGAVSVDVGDRYPLEDIAKAHDRVDAGGRGRVVVTVPG